MAVERPTVEQVRTYLDGGGNSCLFCRGKDIEAGPVEADGESAWSDVSCASCSRTWRDVFLLGAVDVLDENGRYVDTMTLDGEPA